MLWFTSFKIAIYSQLRSDRVVHATLNFWLTLTKPEVYDLGFLVESAGSNPVATAPRFRIEWSSLSGAMLTFEFSQAW